MSDVVRYDVSDGVAVVTIVRPEVRNAMDLDVFQGLFEAGSRAGGDPDVRAVVVAGEGSAFSSGIDISIFGGADGRLEPVTADIGFFQRAYSIFERIPKPTIAAVAGPAFGGGLQLAIACDLRVAADDAVFSVMETRWGIIPDLGATHRLPRLVGIGRAKELAFSGRRFDATEARDVGLVERLVPAGEHLTQALAWARELAAGPPIALAAIKRLMNAAFDEPVGVGLEREAMVQRRVLASEDFAEAVRARFAKEEPGYRGR